MTEKLNYLEVKVASLDDYDYIEYYLEKMEGEVTLASLDYKQKLRFLKSNLYYLDAPSPTEVLSSSKKRQGRACRPRSNIHNEWVAKVFAQGQCDTNQFQVKPAGVQVLCASKKEFTQEQLSIIRCEIENRLLEEGECVIM